MDIKNCTPVLFVSDAKRASEFYSQVLGLTITGDFGGLNYIFKEGFALWQIMDDNIIPRTLGMAKITNSGATSRFELCFETPDIDSVHRELKNSGVKFLHEMNEELWGQRTVRFYDPDGHLIEVGEAMPVFLKRIFEEENGDLEATAKRTYTTPEMLAHFLNE